jgi:hypothetical protein
VDQYRIAELFDRGAPSTFRWQRTVPPFNEVEYVNKRLPYVDRPAMVPAHYRYPR